MTSKTETGEPTTSERKGSGNLPCRDRELPVRQATLSSSGSRPGTAAGSTGRGASFPALIELEQRCWSRRRPAAPNDDSLADFAEHYQNENAKFNSGNFLVRGDAERSSGSRARGVGRQHAGNDRRGGPEDPA